MGVTKVSNSKTSSSKSLKVTRIGKLVLFDRLYARYPINLSLQLSDDGVSMWLETARLLTFEPPPFLLHNHGQSTVVSGGTWRKYVKNRQRWGSVGYIFRFSRFACRPPFFGGHSPLTPTTSSPLGFSDSSVPVSQTALSWIRHRNLPHVIGRNGRSG